MKRQHLSLALSLALTPTALALTACGSSSDSQLDAELHQEYGALGAADRADRPFDRADADDSSRFPTICRELALDVDVRDRERTADGRELGRDDGESRDDVDGRTDRVRAVFGTRESGARVWFARIDDADGRRALLAGETDDDGRVTGRVLDREHRVRGVFVGRRDGDHLRARIRLACRDLANEGDREEHDEDNARAREAAERVERGDGERAQERPAMRDDATRPAARERTVGDRGERPADGTRR